MRIGPLLKVEEGYCRARLRTMARPMPLFAPVTVATRENDMVLVVFWRAVWEWNGFGGKTCWFDVVTNVERVTVSNPKIEDVGAASSCRSQFFHIGDKRFRFPYN